MWTLLRCPQGAQDWRGVVKGIASAPSWAAVAEQAERGGLQARLDALLALLHGARDGLPPYLEARHHRQPELV